MIQLLNGKALRKELGISTTLFYEFRRAGMPYHQLPGGRAYYLLDDVETWLKTSAFHKEEKWTK
ncbi:hypothetical protein L2302_08965 [Lactobacillus gasseri]|jgi:hypothetical protein|uniref:hypothetical protein n=1 Tax=Lactobacillus TaxID=1578 RepID=UPI0001A57FD5|nr:MULTISPECIES: hypothetical protein [Lactobacillus]EEQ26708.1 hypothetical protein HMPREF0890_0796 [Lactobacillus gasseri 202-4]MCT3322095.1 hypothetical protein [Lactobacillus johnsonii]MCT3340438.1 hypothetical protein [Lactobacillus johnsonii]MCT3388611.1 hypothetical protein [Lactobacillus johnsonii]MCT7705001.1 hypothetical protein [Lactobacillus gasseri]